MPKIQKQESILNFPSFLKSIVFSTKNCAFIKHHTTLSTSLKGNYLHPTKFFELNKEKIYMINAGRITRNLKNLEITLQYTHELTFKVFVLC